MRIYKSTEKIELLTMRFFSLLTSNVLAAVVTLTDGNFESLTKIGTDHQTEKWFIKFFAPWCPHCKRMADDWVEMSDNVGDVKVGEIDATFEERLRRKYAISGFPRMYLFDTDGKYYKYPGARNAKAFEAFALGGYKKTEPVRADE